MTDPTPKAEPRARPKRARWRRRFFRSPLAVLGFAIISGFLLIVAFAPFLAPYNPASQNLRATYVPPLQGVSLRGPDDRFGLWVHPVSRSPVAGVVVDETAQYPVRLFVRGQSWSWFFGLIRSDLRLFGVDGPVRFHLLGTDEQGRDLLSRLIHGAWISLFIGLISVIIGISVGVPIGAISGFFGGSLDMVIQRIVDTMLAFPGILLAIVLVAMLGTGLTNVMIAVGIASIPIYARLVRGSVLSVRSREFVEAARAIGRPDIVILFRHVIPNSLAPIIVQSSLQMAVAPHVATFPGLAIVLVVLGFNLVGDALRDALDPRTR